MAGFGPAQRVLIWTAITAATAAASRWLSLTLEERPAQRKPGPTTACNPAAARDEQRLADSPVWRWVERRLAIRALEPFRVRPSFRRLRILNLDHGPGGIATALRLVAPLDATVVATDPVPGMGDLALHRARRRRLRQLPAFTQAWSHALPFQSGAFDLVVAAGALHQWPDAEAALAEIRRVLTPEGRYLVGDVRRDLPAWLWLAVSLAQSAVVPKDLSAAGEPTSSVRAAYAPHEAEWLAARAKLPGLRVTTGPAWLMIERERAVPLA